VSDGLTRSFDPQGEARAVLQSAVTDFGVKVLSNATILEGICEDRLPDLPREASLIASAARADVVGMLQQQAGGVGPDAAVRLTAGALADSRSLDPAACFWVVREFARALGYPVSDSATPPAAPAGPPAAGGAPPLPTMPAAAGAATGAAAAPAAAGPMAAGPMDAPTMMPAGSAAAAAAATPAPLPPVPGPPPGAPAAQPMGFNQPPAPGAFDQPPGPGAFNQPPTPGAFDQPPAPAGFNQPPAGGITQPPAAGGYRFSNPNQAGGFGSPSPAPGQAGWGGQGGNAGFQQPPAPWPAPAPRTGRSRGPLLAGGGVLAVIVLYFVIAGVASLPPFGHKPTPAPSHSAAASSPAPSPAPTSAALAHLRTLIPPAYLSQGNCVPKNPTWTGETAEMSCVNIPSSPAEHVGYYLFDNTTDLNAAYNSFLVRFAHTTQGSGSCGSFTAFTPCETPFGPGHTTAGRMVEYLYKGTPDISFTDTKDVLLIDITGSNGTSLVTWWAKLPMPWVTSG
jgi:hypothetical protein